MVGERIRQQIISALVHFTRSLFYAPWWETCLWKTLC